MQLLDENKKWDRRFSYDEDEGEMNFVFHMRKQQTKVIPRSCALCIKRNVPLISRQHSLLFSH